METIHGENYTLRLISGDLSILQGGVLCPQGSGIEKQHQGVRFSRTKQREGSRAGSQIPLVLNLFPSTKILSLCLGNTRTCSNMP